MTFRLNWPYVIACVVICGSSLAFMGYVVTSQTYRDWTQGYTRAHGFTWPGVAALDLAFILTFVALVWHVYCIARTRFGPEHLSQPGLFGVRIIAWSDVRRVTVFNGVGYHVHAGRRRIILTPFAYAQPGAVVTLLADEVRRHAAQGPVPPIRSV